MLLVHQAIEKSLSFVLLFSVAVAAVIAADLSQAEDLFPPDGDWSSPVTDQNRLLNKILMSVHVSSEECKTGALTESLALNGHLVRTVAGSPAVEVKLLKPNVGSTS